MNIAEARAMFKGLGGAIRAGFIGLLERDYDYLAFDRDCLAIDEPLADC